MTERDGSKARASAICIQAEHLLRMAGKLPEKTAGRCLFRQQRPMTSRCCWSKHALARLRGKMGETARRGHERYRHGGDFCEWGRSTVRAGQRTENRPFSGKTATQPEWPSRENA